MARLVLNLADRLPDDADVEPGSINGSPGIVVRVGQHPYFVLAVEVVDERVQGIKVVVNPDKLAAIDQPHVIR